MREVGRKRRKRGIFYPALFTDDIEEKEEEEKE